MGGASPPSAPNIAQEYQKMINIQAKALPGQLAQELGFRQQYDPAYVQTQQALQSQFGPTQYAQQLQALQQLDPTGTKLRTQLGQTLGSQLALGTGMSPEQQQQLQSAYRARQAATGGAELGAAPALGELITQGQYGQQLLQQREQAALGFQYAPGPVQEIQGIAPVQPATGFQYVNPSAGLQGIQAGQQQYANQLAAWQAGGGSQPPFWLSGLQSLGQTAATVYGGPAGGVGAAGLSGLFNSQLGYGGGSGSGLFSDSRLKNHIEYVGQSPNGHPIYEFEYDELPNRRFRGTIAQHLIHTAPEACSIFSDGFYRVDYSKIDIELQELGVTVHG